MPNTLWSHIGTIVSLLILFSIKLNSFQREREVYIFSPLHTPLCHPSLSCLYSVYTIYILCLYNSSNFYMVQKQMFINTHVVIQHMFNNTHFMFIDEHWCNVFQILAIIRKMTLAHALSQNNKYHAIKMSWWWDKEIITLYNYLLKPRWWDKTNIPLYNYLLKPLSLWNSLIIKGSFFLSLIN